MRDFLTFLAGVAFTVNATADCLPLLKKKVAEAESAAFNTRAQSIAVPLVISGVFGGPGVGLGLLTGGPMTTSANLDEEMAEDYRQKYGRTVKLIQDSYMGNGVQLNKVHQQLSQDPNCIQKTKAELAETIITQNRYDEYCPYNWRVSRYLGWDVHDIKVYDDVVDSLCND